jgi:hypothetical protein
MRVLFQSFNQNKSPPKRALFAPPVSRHRVRPAIIWPVFTGAFDVRVEVLPHRGAFNSAPSVAFGSSQ